MPRYRSRLDWRKVEEEEEEKTGGREVWMMGIFCG